MKKPKKMASGGADLTAGDLRSLRNAGMSADTSNRAAELEAHRKRQDAAERAAKQRAARKNPAPVTATTGGRGSDRVMKPSTTGGRLSAKKTYSDYQMGKPFEDDGLGAISPYNRARALAEQESPIGYKNGKLMTDEQMLKAAEEMGTDLPQIRERLYGRSSEYGYRKGGKVKKMASGGRARSYEDMDAGAGGGMGRIEKTAIAKTGKKIAMKYKKGGTIRMASGSPGIGPGMDEDYTANPLNDSGYKELREKSKRKSKFAAKGGKMDSWEGSKADEAQDKKLAKKYGMSMKEWEASSQDAKHDRQKSAKGLKKGGSPKRMFAGMGVGAPGMATRPGFPAPNVRSQFSGPVPRGGGRGRPTVNKPEDGGGLGATPRADIQGAMKKGGKVMKHDKGCSCMKCGGKAKYAGGGKMSVSQDGKKAPLRARPTAMAKGGRVNFGSIKPLPGTKTKSNPGTVLTGASLKPQGFKTGKAKASGAKPSGMMSPLKQTKSVKMASGGKVRGTGIAQRGTKFIGEV